MPSLKYQKSFQKNFQFKSLDRILHFYKLVIKCKSIEYVLKNIISRDLKIDLISNRVNKIAVNSNEFNKKAFDMSYKKTKFESRHKCETKSY